MKISHATSHIYHAANILYIILFRRSSSLWYWIQRTLITTRSTPADKSCLFILLLSVLHVIKLQKYHPKCQKIRVKRRWRASRSMDQMLVCECIKGETLHNFGWLLLNELGTTWGRRKRSLTPEMVLCGNSRTRNPLTRGTVPYRLNYTWPKRGRRRRRRWRRRHHGRCDIPDKRNVSRE